MKVCTELIVWIDYIEKDDLYILGYLGSREQIASISRNNADDIPKMIWNMLHKDTR